MPTDNTTTITVDNGTVDIENGAAHPRMTITSNGGIVITVPYAPAELEISNVAAGWQEINRPGRHPIVAPTGRQLPKVSCEFVCADPAGGSVRDVLERIAQIAADPLAAVKIDGHPTVDRWPHIAWWRVTSCAVKTTQLQPGTNEPVMASVSLSLVARSDAVIAAGVGVNPYAPGTDSLVSEPPAGGPSSTANPTTIFNPDADITNPRSTGLPVDPKVDPKAKKALDDMLGNMPSNGPTGPEVVLAPSHGVAGKTITVDCPGFHTPVTVPGCRAAWETIAARLARPKVDAGRVATEAGYSLSPLDGAVPVPPVTVRVKDAAGVVVAVQIT